MLFISRYNKHLYKDKMQNRSFGFNAKAIKDNFPSTLIYKPDTYKQVSEKGKWS